MRSATFVRTALATVAGIVVLASSAFGQGVTTAAINGTVTDQTSKPLANVAITAVHQPTGSTYQTLTRADGRYNLNGLRVGGPYTVTADLIGYGEEQIEDIRLALGANQRIGFVLSEQAIELEGIQVTAERGAIMSSSHTGAEVNVSSQEIEALPSIARSIQDFARLSPQAIGTNIGDSENIGGVNIAGKNNRYNNIQIDGAILNDVFGLPASGTPGGQANAQPISLDAVQEFNVNIAPYDVREGGFTGGLINAITRSGTNTYEGSAYFYGRNQDLTGKLDGEKIANFDEFWTGARLGGPIVKDKLFFFVTGEVKNQGRPLEVGFADTNAPVRFAGTQADVEQVQSIAQNTWGYDPGGFGNLSRSTDDYKLFGRLDWNISPDHKLTFRVNWVNATSARGIVRTSYEYGLDSQGYDFDSKQLSTVLQLNSRFGPSITNEARVAYQRQRDTRNPGYAPFPEVSVDVTGGGDDVVLGIERFSQANALDQDVIELTDNLTYFLGDHSITLGTHNEWYKFNNLFVQDFYGSYEFDTIDDWQAGTPTRYNYSYLLPGGNERAKWDAFQLGFYAQDDWQPTEQLSLTLGLRVDIPVMPDKPTANPAFADAFGEFGYATDKVPTGNLLWSPRLGFNYAVDPERNTQLRGGAGIFTGRNPFVWISNQYSNTGVDFGRIDCATFRGCDTPMFQPDPFDQPVSGVGGVANTSEVDFTDPNFKFPTSFRANLGLDQALQPGIIGTIEGIYTKNIYDVFWRDLNLVRQSENGEPATAIDGRPLYSSTPYDPQFTRVLQLTNARKGYQYQITGQLRKQYDQGYLPNLSGQVAYTYSRAEDANSGTNSRAISNWQYNEVIDPNVPMSGRSDFEIQHSILANVTYRFQYGEGKAWSTEVSAWYRGRSGRPFSYIYYGDANGDGATSNDLVFVPGSGDAIFDTGCSNCLGESEWQTFLDSDQSLRDFMGGIAERNSSREPWSNDFDIRVVQTIPTVRQQTLQLFLDWLNVFSIDQKYMPFQSKTILAFRGYDEATGKPIVRFTQGDFNDDGVVTRADVFSTDNLLSRWQIQLGARYNFNF